MLWRVVLGVVLACRLVCDAQLAGVKQVVTTPPLLDQSYEPGPNYLYIPPIPKPLFDFISQVQTSFVNKVVSFTFPDFSPCFDYSVFEMVDGSNMRVTAYSSRFQLRDLAEHKGSELIRQLIARTRPLAINHEKNLSAQMMRQSLYNVAHNLPPMVEFLHIHSDERLHAAIKRLMPKGMRYAVGIPIIIDRRPIGVLWGIHQRSFNADQRRDVRQQMISLSRAIDFIVSEEFPENDSYTARRKIEKHDPTADLESLVYTQFPGQDKPIKSMVLYSTRYAEKYRQDTNYIVPTVDGFSISLKRYLPEHLNGQERILLMIPGFFCNRSIMDRLAKEMALEHGYTVFTLDMRGRSKDTLPRRIFTNYHWSVDNYVWEDFPAALKWLKATHPGKKVVVFGHSMGGFIPLFYSAAYDKYGKERSGQLAIKPESIIDGIISITSPIYIRLGTENAWFNMFRKSAKLITGNVLAEPLMQLVNFTLSTAVGSIDLNKFFTFLNSISASIRAVSFDVTYRLPTLKEFIGYVQITPPEWYFMMEDVFCEESILVISQFLRSLIDGDNFMSIDRKINYTLECNELEIPHFTVIGTLDEIAPPDTVRQGHLAGKSPKNRVAEYRQGHLGIITHPETVRQIAADTDEWIRSLPVNYIS
ncbi:MAG: alpha/beta fold hydrolase [Turneriella sp.]|nr:alpha/beta fold hydrolase [Turneriella sp.]